LHAEGFHHAHIEALDPVVRIEKENRAAAVDLHA